MWELTSAYCRGINAWMGATAGNWPIEFDLLDYQPAPWTVIDTLAIIGEFRWLRNQMPEISVSSDFGAGPDLPRNCPFRPEMRGTEMPLQK